MMLAGHSHRDDSIADEMQTDGLRPHIFFKMADDCVARHPVQLIKPAGGRENRVTGGLCRVAALGRLMHDKR